MEKSIINFRPQTAARSELMGVTYTTVNVGVKERAEGPEPREDEENVNDEQWYECLSATFRGEVTLRDILSVIDKALPMEELTDEELTAIADITGGRDYDIMVSAMVDARYSADKMQAIQNNYLEALSEGREPDEEFVEMQRWRVECKARARGIIGN